MRRSVFSAIVACACSLLAAGSAAAYGSCGNDYSSNTACGVTSPGSYQGAIQANNERDYYVFFAQGGTNLAASLTDNEDPGCSVDGSGSTCATGDMVLYDSQGNDIAHSSSQGPNASPVNGINVSASIHQVLDTAGTYYLTVEGDQGTNAMGNPTAMPYTLGVNASPGVYWPPPSSPSPPASNPPPAPPKSWHRVTRCHKVRVRRHHHWVKVRRCHKVWVYN